MFFFELCGDHRVLRVLTHSFPTRRSSDLHAVPQGAGKHVGIERQGDGGEAPRPNTPKTQRQNRASSKAALASSGGMRSEEHTSELQSLMRISYAVFCLKTKKPTEQTFHPKNHPIAES